MAPGRPELVSRSAGMLLMRAAFLLPFSLSSPHLCAIAPQFPPCCGVVRFSIFQRTCPVNGRGGRGQLASRRPTERLAPRRDHRNDP